MRALILLILLVTATALQAQSQNACSSVFYTIPANLNDYGFYRDLDLTTNTIFPAKNLHHVFQGDLAFISPVGAPQGTKRRPGIDGGLHTKSGFDRFFQMRPDLVELITRHPELRVQYPNGVVKWLLPEDAFANRTNMATRETRTSEGIIRTGVKTMFPAAWGNRKILDSVRHTLTHGKIMIEDGRIARAGDGEVYRVEGNFEGVLVVVIIRNSARPVVISAYPAGDQRMAPDREAAVMPYLDQAG
jgi:hypothetical protein